MKKFTKLLLALTLCVLGVGSANAERLDLTFGTEWYCTASWNSTTRIFSWGSGGVGNPDWTFINVTNLSGDVSGYTKMTFKLEDFTNSSETKLTLYFKENKGNTQSMDYVAKVDLVPNANGVVEVDLSTFDWKNNKTPSETIDNTNIYDVTVYGAPRTDGSQDGTVKITEAYLEKPDPEITVTYKLYYGGSLVASQETGANAGDPAEVPTAINNPFCTYSYSPATITESGDITVTVTWNGPIAIASDYASINWKNLYLNRSKKWYLNNGESPCLVGDPSNSDRAADSYLWGLVGNPYSYKIYNKAAGSTKTLNGSAAMADGEYSWTKMAKNGDGILFGRSDGQYLNQAGGDGNTGLGFWGDNKDAGSTFFVGDVITEPVAPLADGELIPDFFSICAEGAIPYGYDVKFGSENRAYPNTYGSGARMFAFAAGGDFTKAIYFRDGYVRYGNEKALTLEAGKNYIVRFNSAMWKNNGATLTFSIFKKGDLANAVFTKTINNTPDVNGSKAAVTGSTRSEINFTPEADGDYILEWKADGFKEVLLANVAVKVAPADPLASYKEALTEKINQGNAQNSFAKTADSFGALTTAISDGEDELANPSATPESLVNAAKAITDAIAGLKLADGYTNLTQSMYKEWDSPTAPTTSSDAECDYVLGTSTGLPYGDSSVKWYHFADMSDFDNLYLLTNDGTPRVMMNRQLPLPEGSEGYDANGGKYVEIKDAPVSGKVTINLHAYDYAHLNAIKGANWANVTITEMLLYRSLTVGSVGYSTFGSLYKNAKLNGTTTYAAKYEGGSIKLTEVTNIPAGKGVIVKATAGDYLPTFDVEASDIESDLLVSNGTVTGDGSTIFALSSGTSGVGFYKVAASVTIPAGKAYMVITGAGAREFVGFGEEEATGIQTVKTAKADQKIFNLNGQRIAQPVKGLNIIGGKKVLK